MMRASSFVFLTFMLFVLVSCNPTSKYRPGKLAQWEKDHGIKQGAQRKPSNTAQQNYSCLKDRFTVETIQKDIQDLATSKGLNLSADTLPKDFKGEDISEFPLLDRYYINQVGSYLPSRDYLNFDGCPNLACVINRMHGKREDDKYGEVYLFWYLKAGRPIKVETGEGSLEEYLFQDDELELLWLSAWLLQGINQPSTWNYIYRFRHGHVLTRSPQACGQASSGSGHIWLADNCLISSNSSGIDRIRAFGYESVIHEMGHHVDFSARTGYASWYGHSHKSNWLEFSAWSKGDTVDPQTGLVVRRGWSPKITSNFMRSYGKNSPEEDFAEAVGYFRTDPTGFRETAPKKYAYIKEKIFKGRDYSPEGIKEFLIPSVKQKVIGQINDIVLQCYKTPEVQGPKIPNGFNIDLKSLKLLPGEAQCLNDQVKATTDEEIGRIASQVWEVCFSDELNESVIYPHIQQEIAPIIKKTRDNIEAVKKRETAQKTIELAFETEVDPSEIYVDCWAQDDDDCYESTFSQLFDRYAQPYKSDLDPIYEDIKFAVLAKYNKDKIEEITNSRYKTMFGQIFEPLKNKAKERVTYCLAQKGRINDPSYIFQPYDGGDTYVIPRLINCININFDEDVYTVIDSSVDSQHRLAKDTNRKFVYHLFSDTYLQEIGQYNADLKFEEDKRLDKIAELVAAKVGEKLFENPEWLRGQKTAHLNCLGQAQIYFKEVLPDIAKKTNPTFNYNGFNKFVEQVTEMGCNLIKAHPKFKGLTGDSADQLIGYTDVFKGILAKQVQKALDECEPSSMETIFKYLPAGSEKLKCLTANSISILEASLEEWDKTPQAHKMGGDREKLTQYVRDNGYSIILEALSLIEKSTKK